MEDLLKSIDATLKEILIELKSQRGDDSSEAAQVRTLQNSPKFDDYKAFFETFVLDTTKRNTVEELIEEYQIEYGDPEFSSRTIGKIFNHFISDKFIKNKKIGKSTKKSYPLTIK